MEERGLVQSNVLPESGQLETQSEHPKSEHSSLSQRQVEICQFLLHRRSEQFAHARCTLAL